MNCFAPEGDQARVYKEIEPDSITLLLCLLLSLQQRESPKDASISQTVEK